ncbi:hypothetical protein [Vibrio sp. TRT 29B02]|uniref:hypothetical protein n=1 Tax=Vibrio sp. TRT 29B02 TaxID=3418508 RepID=UPI003CFAD3FA
MLIIEAVRIQEYDDDVHISGLGFSAPNTLCGITDAGSKEPTDETPNCHDCVEVYESIKNHRPRFKFKK